MCPAAVGQAASTQVGGRALPATATWWGGIDAGRRPDSAGDRNLVGRHRRGSEAGLCRRPQPGGRQCRACRSIGAPRRRPRPDGARQPASPRPVRRLRTPAPQASPASAASEALLPLHRSGSGSRPDSTPQAVPCAYAAQTVARRHPVPESQGFYEHERQSDEHQSRNPHCTPRANRGSAA